MHSDRLKKLPVLHFEQLNKEADLYHFVTTRSSETNNEGPTFNLGVMGEADPVTGRKNRASLAQWLEISEERLLFMKQVHGEEILIVGHDFFGQDEKTRQGKLEGVDAMITGETGTCLCALGADCGTILLFDPTNRIIACIHAGWRGTVKKLAGKVVKEMQQHFNVDPRNILAGIGPCISGASYEVGEEVANQFEAIFGKDEAIVLHPKNHLKPHVDIAAANTKLLLESGLQPQHIEQSGFCTFGSNELFFSARKGDTGRFCSGIFLRSE